MLSEIIVIYPIPGHSSLDRDRNFARIEKNRSKKEKVSFPSEWVDLVRRTDKKFNINYVNFPLTDDLMPHGSPVIVIKDFKTYFEKFLLNNVDQLTQIRKITFDINGIHGTTDLLSEVFDKPINLIEPKLLIKSSLKI
jgi:hypothetical protein